MSIREEQCNKVCRILDDVLANRPTERDSLIVAVRKAFKALELFGNSDERRGMKNADKFKTVFGLYATELWAMPEEEFLKWLNSESTETEQRWIPCSERLPEEYKYVLLCDRELEPYEEAGYSRMAVGWLEDDGKLYCWDDSVARNEFVAWMPLPEPYKEGEQK